MAARGPNDEWRRAQDAVRQMLDRNAAQLRRITDTHSKRYLEQLERIRRQAEGPSRELARIVERAREAIEGPARQLNRQYEALQRVLQPYDVGEILRRAA